MMIDPHTTEDSMDNKKTMDQVRDEKYNTWRLAAAIYGEHSVEADAAARGYAESATGMNAEIATY